MKKLGLLGTSALGSAAFIGMSFAAAAPAFAQTPTTTNSQEQAQPGSQPGDSPDTNKLNPQSEVEVESGQSADNQTSIVVTGSRIRRPNLESNVPITSLSAEELPNQGQANLGDALNDLPSLRSTFSQQNSGRFIGTAGQNFLDLRGLGTTRTLVLVNNRRHITASPGDFVVDVNTIPQDLVDRIDVVTGGSSAIYGSDAVAGVVNFVLKRNFDGIRLRAQDGISSNADRGIQFVTLTAGRNFAGDRGNIAVSLEYTNAEPLFFRDRPGLTGAFSGRCQFQLTENTTGEPAAGNGVPDNTFLCGINNAALSNGGTIAQLNAAGDYLRFDRNGNLFVDTPTKSFRPIGSGNQQGGQGSTLRNTGQLAVGQDRYTANVLAHFDFSDALRFFVEGKYVHQRVLQEGQPSFFQGSLKNLANTDEQFAAISNLRCNNPFLNAQALATLQGTGRCLNVATGTFTLGGRFNTDFGGRAEISKRDTYRIVTGIEGDFNGDWHYELSFNYGKFKSTNIEKNDLLLFDVNGNLAGFLLATDAVRNAQGQIVCRANLTTVTAPGCVPINLFGEGAPSQEALNYVNTTSFVYSKAAEYDALAFVSGDLSQLFELPGGPVGFSVGLEYRKETAHQIADPLSASGGTFFNAFSEFSPPAFTVKEAFGEINIPILKDLPFAHELSVSGAARYSDYNTSAGNTFSYNLNGTYAPFSDIRFRANYSKSVRVPTLSDLYSPASQNFGFVADPCDAQNISGGPNRAKNCAALGVPTTISAASPCASSSTPAGSPFINCTARAQTIGYQSGGNDQLTAETGKSLTIGGVLTPRWIPGFSLTVDYFDIKVTNLIATLSAQTILNQCVDQTDINNQFCALINPRDAFGLFADPALLSSGVNYAKQTTRGVDVDLAYRHNFGNGQRVNVRGIATYTLERNNFVNPVDPTFADRQLSELGDPVFSASLQLGYGFQAFDLNYTMRFIGKQTISTYEAQHTFQGRPPTNADVLPRVHYPSVMYHDVRLAYKVNDKYRFYLGMDNVLNRKPPLGLLGTEAASPYSSIGRYMYGGLQVDF